MQVAIFLLFWYCCFLVSLCSLLLIVSASSGHQRWPEVRTQKTTYLIYVISVFRHSHSDFCIHRCFSPAGKGAGYQRLKKIRQSSKTHLCRKMYLSHQYALFSEGFDRISLSLFLFIIRLAHVLSMKAWLHSPP